MSYDALIKNATVEAILDDKLIKNAVDGLNDFIRIQVREDGIVRRAVLPPIPIDNSELDRAVHTDKPQKIVDIEPLTEMAIDVGFNTGPDNWYIRTRRMRVTFRRIETPRYRKDVEELRTYHMDVREIITSNIIKDITYREDIGFFDAVRRALGGSAGTTMPTGDVLWQSFTGGVTRANLALSTTIMPKTIYHIQPRVAVVNNVFIAEVLKFTRDTIGGDRAEDLFFGGWANVQNVFGVDWAVTIKRDVVADNFIYYFAEPKFLGKFYELSPAVLSVDKELPWITFWALETIGVGIAHAYGMAIAQF